MLSSAEVGTLITALGCGIGREEFDADKLRYHRIIIMTDADVDGSHIRTLLLTFFYRQMPELIERGHIYIAQPPLYKVKKGKQERYVKDDAELNDYLLQVALENADLHVSEKAPAITGVTLETLAKQFLAVMSTIKRLSRRYHADLLEKMIYMKPFSSDAMKDKAGAEAWFKELETRLNDSGNTSVRYEISVEEDTGHGTMRAKVNAISHSVGNERMINTDFFASAEYQSMVTLGGQLDGLLEEDAYIQRGERKTSVSHFKQVLSWLMEEAKRGQHIQRYKGLGEMNPDQLWETTLDMTARRLLQVQIDDAVAADEVFTTLMGDQVEPRREFIEANALQVANLDV
jgi:DNA gyrase subunit B